MYYMLLAVLEFFGGHDQVGDDFWFVSAVASQCIDDSSLRECL